LKAARAESDVAATLHSLPASISSSGQTARLLGFVQGLRWDDLDEEVRAAAKRHLLDTLGVMVAGGAGDIAGKAEGVIAALRPAGTVPVPGRHRRADVLDAAWLGGTGAHGIELDDGYRQGSVHPGVSVVPALLACAHGRTLSGRDLLTALVAGYETVTAVARAGHPQMRRRGFHPTGIVGSLGAAMAVGRLLELDARRLGHALGLAASASAGLFAFLGGGADVKRLHAGHAAREGLTAALLAEAGVEGPPRVLEASDGFLQAFAGERGAPPPPLGLPPEVGFGIADCYIKPYPCCRHLQPAVEALMALRATEGLAPDEVEAISVETYGIAADHAATGWGDFASAQLSFPFIMALGLKFGSIELGHFDQAMRASTAIADICRKVSVTADPALDALYPEFRPARVTVTTARGRFVSEAREALGSRLVPLDEAGLLSKFTTLTRPVLGPEAAERLLNLLLTIEVLPDVSVLAEAIALPERAPL
jgi:2-methylcitrate dehydratase PrpD